MTRLLALAAAIAACAVVPSTAFAAVEDTRSALWRFDEATGATDLVGNPGFESNANDHASAAGYFTAAATGVSRDTTSAHSGSASGVVTVPGSAAYEGERYRITYPFRKGVRYTFSVWVRSASATKDVNAALGIGSDNAGASDGPRRLSTTWQRLTGTWIPTADRTSADLGVYLPVAAGSSKSFQVDDLSVAETDLVGNPGFESDDSGYSRDAGYFTAAGTSVSRDTTSAHSGSASGAVTVPGSVAYEGGRYRITYPFQAGVRYTFSLWVRSASATNNVNAALGGTNVDNTGASNGPLALSATWQRLTGTWTPTANRSSADLGVYLPAAAGSAKTFQIDDVSVEVPAFSAKDAKGSNNGTYNGGSTLSHAGATPDGGRAVLLDGVNGRITTTYNPFASAATRTFEGWAKRSTNGTDDALLAGDAAVGYPVLRALAGGNSVRFNPNTTGLGQDFTNALPGTGVWFHWALVWNDATRQATLYVDGVSKGTKTFLFGLGSPGNLELGAEGGTTNPFNGYLDDVAVYDYGLTASEVKQVMGCDEIAYPPGTSGATITTPGQLDAALDTGETGCFRGGTYEETNRTITTPGATFRPYGAEAVTWRGRLVIAADDVTVRGMTLDGSYGPTCGSDANCLARNNAAPVEDRCYDVDKCTFSSPVLHAEGIKLLDNEISNRRTGDSERAGICVNESNSGDPVSYEIAFNRIHHCGQLSSSTGSPRNHDHGIYVGAGGVGNGGDIHDNVIFDNADRGIQLFPEAANVTVRNNTIDGNGEGINLNLRSHDNTLDKNVITNSYWRWNVEGPAITGTGNVMTNTCLRASNADSYYNSDNGIESYFRGDVAISNDIQAPSNVYADRTTKDFRLSGTCRSNGWGAPDSVATP
ncbi:MAG TPA: carbohydrate binding domain-containing protein [Thermoleophilaceae bacterium]